MEYSNTTTKMGCIQYIELLLGVNDGHISGDTTRFAQVTGIFNMAMDTVVTWILSSQSGWEWDDASYSNFPEVVGDLTDGIGDYPLPSATTSSNENTFLKLLDVEVKDASGYFQRLKRIDNKTFDTPLTTLFSENGMPQYYRETANSIELWPMPAADQVTIVDGLRVRFQRTADPFDVTDSAREPSIARPFHKLICKITALEYGESRGIGRIDYLKKGIEEGKKDLMESYANKNEDNDMRITRNHTSGI